ncbi:hypothetical protein F4780DRAFT_564678 [Xylariomycetidae sp. FL0641]|nr:hypothetical protein F4780DRAFT_564678 [Xylariomycetidae sp. FL0641]
MAAQYVAKHPSSLALRLFIASLVITVMVLCTVLLRLLSRHYVSRRLGRDDCLVVVATLAAIVQQILFTLLCWAGIGTSEIPPANEYAIPKLLFSFEVLYLVSQCTAKLSALFFYQQLFPENPMRKLTWASVGVVTAGFFGLLLWQFLFCHPLAQMFQSDGLQKCGDRKPLYVAISAFVVFTNVLLLALPMPSIWSLKPRRSTKMRLLCLFAAALFVTSVSTTRLAYTTQLDYGGGFTYAELSTMFLAMLECGLTVKCISLPMVYLLYAKYVRVLPGGEKRRSSLLNGGRPTTRTTFNARTDPSHRDFKPLETTTTDPFELEIYSPAPRLVQYNFTVDKGPKRSKSTSKILKSPPPHLSKAVVETGSQDELVIEAAADEERKTPLHGNGILVSKDWSVSRT